MFEDNKYVLKCFTSYIRYASEAHFKAVEMIRLYRGKNIVTLIFFPLPFCTKISQILPTRYNDSMAHNHENKNTAVHKHKEDIREYCIIKIPKFNIV